MLSSIRALAAASGDGARRLFSFSHFDVEMFRLWVDVEVAKVRTGGSFQRALVVF